LQSYDVPCYATLQDADAVKAVINLYDLSQSQVK